MFKIILISMCIGLCGQELSIDSVLEGDITWEFDLYESYDYEPVITDSIVWHTTKVILEGEPFCILCIHEWVYSKEWKKRPFILDMEGEDIVVKYAKLEK